MMSTDALEIVQIHTLQLKMMNGMFLSEGGKAAFTLMILGCLVV